MGDGVNELGRNALQGADEREQFEQAVLPHLDAAYNLARWLTRNDHDAEDLVQAACLRTVKFFGGFRGANSRAWLLTIVRNTCYTWIEEKRGRGPDTAFDEEIHGVETSTMGPERAVLRQEDEQSVRRAVEELPVELVRLSSFANCKGCLTRRLPPSPGFPWVRSCPGWPVPASGFVSGLASCGTGG